MNRRIKNESRVLEIMLIVIALGMTFLLHQMGAYKIVVLNLFFLPIVLSGYFLGRTSAGTLAVLSVLAVTVVVSQNSMGMAAFNTPLMMGLAITVWGAALGLTAILVGTLCDERSKTVDELHGAYVGVVEVLSRYLQSANPNDKSRSIRVAELCQEVAEELRIPRKGIDDIRVGALLYDLGNMEITTQLLGRAVDTLEASSAKTSSHTFSGMDLVHSLGSVLSGAVPLLLSQDGSPAEQWAAESGQDAVQVPIGAKVIKTVRAFDAVAFDPNSMHTPLEAVSELRMDISVGYDPDVLDALERCVMRPNKSTKLETACIT